MIINFILHAQDGDQKSMLALLEKFNPIINKYTRMLNTEDAKEDITLAFIELIMRMQLSTIKRHDEGTMVKYIQTSMYHTYIKLSKKVYQRYREIPMSAVSDCCKSIYGTSLAIYDDYKNTDIQRVLTRKECEVITLYFNGVKIADIAKRMGICRQTTNETKLRALRKLRDFYCDFKNS